MSPNQNLAARTAVSVLFSLLAVVAVQMRKLLLISRQSFDRLAIASFLVSRWGLYLAIFVVAHIAPHGDVSIYVEEATAVLHGQLPYRDFLSSYAPLHCFLDAGLMRLWFTPKVIIVFAIFAECFLVPLWLRMAREFFVERDVRIGTLLYLTSALSVQFVTVDGQDNVAVALLFGLCLFLILRSRLVASGFAIGAGISIFKFLPLLYLPMFLRVVKSPFKWIAGIAIPVAIVYGAALAQHLNILMPLSRESYRTANCIPYLVEALFGITVSSAVWNGLLLLVLGVVLVVTLQAMQAAPQTARMRILTLGIAAVTLVILSIPKKSWPPYFLLALFPVCLLIAPLSRGKIALFAAFQVLCVAIPSVWADVFDLDDALPLHALLLAHKPVAILFYLGQTLLVAGYLVMLWEALKQIRGWRTYPDLTLTASGNLTSTGRISG